jgi:hypothetical protein
MCLLASVSRIFARNRQGKFSAFAISAVVMNLAADLRAIYTRAQIPYSDALE